MATFENRENRLTSFPPGGLAVVIGSSGAIGGSLLTLLQDDQGFAGATGFSRNGDPAIDITLETTIAAAAAYVAAQSAPLRLVIDATGFLHGDGAMPEKSWRELDPAQIAQAFAVNATGPALLMKHFLPLLPREGKSVFATLSAKVGSIGDNELGGWYSYRASKAALNQFVRTAAIELNRRKPEAICVALHPGTVASKLSAPFANTGLEVRAPETAAANLLAVIDRLSSASSSNFFDHTGARLPW